MKPNPTRHTPHREHMNKLSLICLVQRRRFSHFFHSHLFSLGPFIFKNTENILSTRIQLKEWMDPYTEKYAYEIKTRFDFPH